MQKLENNSLVLRFILYECMKSFHSYGEWHKQKKDLSTHAPMQSMLANLVRSISTKSLKHNKMLST